jgi:stage III sporulation protein AE
MVGSPGICKLIDGLGSAFGLVLGMTGACAMLLLVSVLALIAAVVP